MIINKKMKKYKHLLIIPKKNNIFIILINLLRIKTTCKNGFAKII